MKSIASLLALGLLAFTLSGCVIAMGNRDLGQPRHNPGTLGQQLIDLKKAREAGALTEDEYHTQRKKLLEEKK
jgi:hypothetical protein